MWRSVVSSCIVSLNQITWKDSKIFNYCFINFFHHWGFTKHLEVALIWNSIIKLLEQNNPRGLKLFKVLFDKFSRSKLVPELMPRCCTEMWMELTWHFNIIFTWFDFYVDDENHSTWNLIQHSFKFYSKISYEEIFGEPKTKLIFILKCYHVSKLWLSFISERFEKVRISIPSQNVHQLKILITNGNKL